MKAFKFIPLSVMLLNVAHAELITADDSSDSMSDRLSRLERSVQALTDMNLLVKFDQLKAEVTTLNRQIDFLQSQAQKQSPPQVEANNSEKPSMREVYALIAQQESAKARDVLAQLASNPSGHDPAEIEFWQGELAYQDKDFNAAVDHFKNILNKHAEHNRAPDSLFKLAEIAKESGDSEQAERLLATLKIQYPDSIANQYSLESKAIN